MDIIRKRSRNEKLDGPFIRFWNKFGYEMMQLAKRYPNLTGERVVNAAKGSKGEWQFSGAPHHAIDTYKKMVAQAARMMGFKGSDEILVQLWLDFHHGDHIVYKDPKPRRDDERVSVVTMADGSKIGYRGRQRVG